MEKQLTCIRCPVGCCLTVYEDGDIVKVSGNNCPLGSDYGLKEITNPTRIVTSSIRVIGGNCTLVSVKTDSDIPKKWFLM